MAERSFLWDSGGGGDASPHSEADVIAFFELMVGGDGVIPGKLNGLAPTLSGSNYRIDTGWAFVAGHPYRNDAMITRVPTIPGAGTTGHRVVLRLDNGAQTVRVVDISSADGTAAIPAEAAGDVTLATYTITTGNVVTLTDAREYGSLVHSPGLGVAGQMLKVNSTRTGYEFAGDKGMKRTINGGPYMIPAAPSGGVSLSSSASPNTYGAWTELIAAAAADLVILGVLFKSQDNSIWNYGQIGIGIGVAAAEVSVGEMGFGGGNSGTQANGMFHTIPPAMFPTPIKILNGQRISARCADGGSTTTGGLLWLIVCNVANLEDF